MIDRFFKQINNQGKFSTTELEHLRAHCKVKQFKKNEIIIQEGEVPNNIYYVVDGCVRLFYNADGKDRTAFFYNEGDFILTFRNLKYSIPTQKNYATVKDTVLVQINKIAVKNLVNLSENFKKIIRDFKEQELIKTHKLIEQFITLSAQKRFEKLLKTNSKLFLQVPQQYIASYVGVSPETLSRIKKQYYQKHRGLIYS